MDCATLDTQTGGGLIKGGLTRIAARRDRTVYIRNPGEALIGLMQDDLTVRIYYIAALEKPRARMYGQSFGRYGTDPYRNVRQTRFPATPTALEGTTALELAERNAITTVIFLNPGRVLRGHQLLGSFGVLLGRLLQARATVVFLSDMQDMAIEEYGLPEEVKAAYHELPVKIVGTNLELELTGRSAEEKAAAVERERLLSAGIS
ncbi:hypothetical protein K438DRAFT_255441 [Mycena galopus ATCC 62051]|nr:hypothetical protein K438DRAFT_255441 [Mycena galopus ATCC 62051]